MIDRVAVKVFLALAVFGFTANAVGFAYLIYNSVRLLMGS